MAENPEETAYYLRLVSMYIDLGTDTVLRVFIHHSPDKDANKFMADKQRELQSLKTNKILNKQQCDLVFTPLPNLNEFDISLLITLIVNLFSTTQLSPPKKGWGIPPTNSDTSIAADLLRLRTIRNMIVGHHSKARLPKWRFDNEWEDVKQILLRIQHIIYPVYEDMLKRKIEEYKLQMLDPCVRNKYDMKLKEWHNDVSKLQDQVEELFTKLSGLDVYLKNKSDRYERYIKLLVKGGRFVLSNFLQDELKRQKQDIRNVIRDKENFFQNNLSNQVHVDTLYPPESNSGQQFDTSTWDTILLAAVLLQVIDCNSDTKIKRAVESISNAEKNYADAVLLSLNSDTFSDYAFDLKYSITFLSSFLETDKNAEIEKILEECKSSSQESQTPHAYFEELKSQGTQLKSITDTFTETLMKTKDCLQQMITHGISFKNEHVLELKMITLGKDEEKNKLAETILTEIWSEAINRSDNTTDFEVVRREVLKMLQEIRKQKDVTNVSIKQKCILLQIACNSPDDLLNLIDYFESDGFERTLGNISKEMGYYINTVFAMHASLTMESLHEILSDSQGPPQEDQLGITLPITVSSPAGMMQLRSFFKSGTITNSANVIADSLSIHLEDTISLAIMTDMKDLQSVFDNTDTDQFSSDSFEDNEGYTANLLRNNNQQTEDDLRTEDVDGDELHIADDARTEYVDRDNIHTEDNARTEDIDGDDIQTADDTRTEYVDRDNKHTEDNDRTEDVEQDDKETEDDARTEDVDRDNKHTEDNAHTENIDKDDKETEDDDRTEYVDRKQTENDTCSESVDRDKTQEFVLAEYKASIKGNANAGEGTEERHAHTQDMPEDWIDLQKHLYEYYIKLLAASTTTSVQYEDMCLNNVYAPLQMERTVKSEFYRGQRWMYMGKRMVESVHDIFFVESNAFQHISVNANTGKTTFCKKLISIWCQDYFSNKQNQQDRQRNSENVITYMSFESTRSQNDDQIYRMIMKQFDFIFYISFKQAKHGDTCIEDLIRHQLLDPKHYVAFKDIIGHSARRCLFIIDDVDMCDDKHKPFDRFTLKWGLQNKMFQCPYVTIFTSRTILSSQYKVDVDINFIGLTNATSKHYAEFILKHLNEQNKKSYHIRDFENAVANAGCGKFKADPYLLRMLVCMWYKSQTLDKSLCRSSFVSALVEYMLSEEKLEHVEYTLGKWMLEHTEYMLDDEKLEHIESTLGEKELEHVESTMGIGKLKHVESMLGAEKQKHVESLLGEEKLEHVESVLCTEKQKHVESILGEEKLKHVESMLGGEWLKQVESTLGEETLKHVESMLGEEKLEHIASMLGVAKLEHVESMLGEEKLEHDESTLGKEKLKHVESVLGEEKLDHGESMLGDEKLEHVESMLGDETPEHVESMLGDEKLKHVESMLGEEKLEHGESMLGEGKLKHVESMLGEGKLKHVESMLGEEKLEHVESTFGEERHMLSMIGEMYLEYPHMSSEDELEYSDMSSDDELEYSDMFSEDELEYSNMSSEDELKYYDMSSDQSLEYCEYMLYEEMKPATRLPQCFHNRKLCNSNSGLIRILAKLAFETLIANTHYFITSTVFRKLNISFNQRERLIRTGLLTKCYPVVDIDATIDVPVSFTHKIFHEFFAALYICENTSNSVPTRLKSCMSLSELIRMSRVFTFVSGMNPEVMCKITEHIANVSDHDHTIVGIRRGDHWDIGSQLDIQTLVTDSISEAIECNHTNFPCYALRDIQVSESTHYETLRYIDPKSIKSLDFKGYNTDVSVQEYMSSVENLESFKISWHYPLRFSERMIEQSDNHLQTIVLGKGDYRESVIYGKHRLQKLCQLKLRRVTLTHTQMTLLLTTCPSLYSVDFGFIQCIGDDECSCAGKVAAAHPWKDTVVKHVNIYYCSGRCFQHIDSASQLVSIRIAGNISVGDIYRMIRSSKHLKRLSMFRVNTGKHKLKVLHTPHLIHLTLINVKLSSETLLTLLANADRILLHDITLTTNTAAYVRDHLEDTNNQYALYEFTKAYKGVMITRSVREKMHQSEKEKIAAHRTFQIPVSRLPMPRYKSIQGAHTKYFASTYKSIQGAHKKMLDCESEEKNIAITSKVSVPLSPMFDLTIKSIHGAHKTMLDSNLRRKFCDYE